MKIKILQLLLFVFILLFQFRLSSQVVRSFTPRYTRSSVRGNIVYVSNSIITSGGVSNAELPPGGTLQNNHGTGVYIDVDNVTSTLLNYGSTWNYFAAGSAPPNDAFINTWKTVAYTLTGTWNTGGSGSGSGKYGYNAGQTTCLPGGCAPICNPANNCNKYTAYYFRTTLNIPTPSSYSTIRLNCKRDDGIVIYINGTERARDNMPGGVPAYGTLASSDINPGVAEDYTIDLNPAFFVPGNNTIAVEVHTVKAKSEDMSFDMQVQGIDDYGTYNSSTADLNLASCSQILFAGLYWGADQGNSGTDISWYTAGYNSCKLKIPGSSSYQSITASAIDQHSNTNVAGLDHTGFLCFADITSIVNQTSPNGTYSVGNIPGPLGIYNACGGWTIVIVYSNPSLAPRNLTVFDGEAIVGSGNPPVDVAINGFLTPPTGAVTCELGAVVYDGDRNQGDAFLFRQNGAGGFYDLTPNATSATADMWNSTISYKGSLVATRNPAYNNTLGYDADIIDLPNAGNAQLGNNKTGATIRFSSPSENYFLHVVTTSILQYNPAFALSKSSLDLNGGTLQPGDIVRYSIAYSNGGNDSSINTKIIDSLPYNISFVPGSLKINGITKTDISSDDQAYYDAATRKIIFHVGTGANASLGGTILVGAGGTVEFDAIVASSCRILDCGSTLKNSARIEYTGVASSQSLYDSSGVFISGCLFQQGVSNVIAGTCFTPSDTTLKNNCSVNSVILPWAKYAGYNIYSAMPFIPANSYNPYTPVTASGTYYAYFNSGTGCSDTITINVVVNVCVDIDDDNDGIPDYVEINDPLALQDHDSDGIPNWNDTGYPGYIDRNGDGFNDNFDPLADSDNDGIPNYRDTDFAGFTDSNGDGINDSMDRDLDGIPNNLDLDSDNDGIPDVVESFGVDANGDGRIDNYSDTDNDGLSQNVDNPGGIAGSGPGLGIIDSDGDGVGNYLDLDSDNDGIPDIIEVFGIAAGNSGKVNVFTDSDADGYTDAFDGDVGNDDIAENSALSLLRTDADGNGDGRTDSWPYKNMDSDAKASPYDLDSDGDGITDTKEAQFTDTNWDGRVDGAVNTDGRNISLAALGSLTIPDTDGNQKSNPYDIDSDDDGIPDNIEGLTTSGYLLPSGLDTDGDGIDNSYDNYTGFGGDGIHIVDTDSDTVPDYLDTDTDGDGMIDRIEGNDLNLNHLPDDNVTLTGSDTDGDGLDNRFDNNNTNAKATSAYMGNGGTTTGDPTPGSITTVQRTPVPYACPAERDWRCVPYILSCNLISFKAVLQGQQVKLSWTVHCDQSISRFIIERRTDGNSFLQVLDVAGRPESNNETAYKAIDNISGINSAVVYYRLKAVNQNGKINVGNIVSVHLQAISVNQLRVVPNPVRTNLQVQLTSDRTADALFTISDATGKTIKTFREKIYSGNNTLVCNPANSLSDGMYYLQVYLDNVMLIQKFSIIR